MAGQRTQQLADRIRVIVASMLERRIKDPRLGFVTITDVRLTGDNQNASVFYTVMGGQEAIEGTAAALKSASGLIRSEVGKQLGLRHTPSIEFFLDAVPENAREIEDLLAKAHEADEAVAAQAAGAQYAGEPDPYKKPPPQAEEILPAGGAPSDEAEEDESEEDRDT
jgi:ribosome-binding factor A